eukprot:m.127048 g.127048  ORF g.127048 m.127048 type:complete len:79 (+) comp19839_c0_seq3:190-426(+)
MHSSAHTYTSHEKQLPFRSAVQQAATATTPISDTFPQEAETPPTCSAIYSMAHMVAVATITRARAQAEFIVPKLCVGK